MIRLFVVNRACDICVLVQIIRRIQYYIIHMRWLNVKNCIGISDDDDNNKLQLNKNTRENNLISRN